MDSRATLARESEAPLVECENLVIAADTGFRPGLELRAALPYGSIPVHN